MKLKDIEKNLKKEQDCKSVPDVYARASKAPLNKLLTGETPARAFQKQVVMNLLIFVLIIFLVMAIGLSAMWLTPKTEAAVAECYVCVTVESEGGIDKVGIVFNESKMAIVTVAEQTNGSFNTSPLVVHSLLFDDFISPKVNDKVSVEFLCGKSLAINDIVRTVVNELEILYNGKVFEMTTSANSSQIRTHIKDYISACSGSTADGESVDELIKTYTELFA